MNLNFVSSGLKKKLILILDDKFGITKLPWLLVETGKQKIRAFSGSMSRDEVAELSNIANVELFGLYLLKQEGSLRISLDGCKVLENQIDKGVLELDEEQFNLWMNGDSLDLKIERGIYIVKFSGDFLGCGISDGQKLINYVPRERRVRYSNS